MVFSVILTSGLIIFKDMHYLFKNDVLLYILIYRYVNSKKQNEYIDHDAPVVLFLCHGQFV